MVRRDSCRTDLLTHSIKGRICWNTSRLLYYIPMLSKILIVTIYKLLNEEPSNTTRER